MIKIYCFFIFIFSFISSAYCQDTLLLYNGMKRVVKVIEISNNMIYYFNTNDTTMRHTIFRNSVAKIIYEDGMIENMFNTIALKNIPDTNTVKYELGRNYAKMYYKKTGLFTLSFLSMTSGLLLAVNSESDYLLLIGPTVTLTAIFWPPKSYVAIPDMNLYRDHEFYRGFRKQAIRQKNKAVLFGFAVGLAVDFAIVLIASQ